MKPYYDEGGITIYHGDCREVELPVLGPGVLLTDPPYGIEGGRGGDARAFQKGAYGSALWKDTPEYIRDVCVPVVESWLEWTERGAVTPGIRHLSLYPTPRDIGCFWTPAAATHGPWGFTTFQPILYYGKDPLAGKGALPSGKAVTETAGPSDHPCPKPLSAWRWLLNKVAERHDLVVDPFMGSGTTLRAAKDLGLNAIGIEIEERYCEIAVQRLAQEVLDVAA